MAVKFSEKNREIYEYFKVKSFVVHR